MFHKIKLTLICFLFLLQEADGQINSKPFAWGINGHPLTQHAYRSISWPVQVDFLKDLKVQYYRFDVLLNKEGGARNEAGLLNFLKLLNDGGKAAMPVLMLPGSELTDSTAIYQQAFNQGKNFGEKYGKAFSVLEVGNEMELRILKGGDGTKASQYDLVKSAQLMIRLKGVIDGLKSVNSMLKVSISLGWTHFYYLELLSQYKVNYDIVGYHWYSNMGYITKVKAPYGDILKKIKDKYNKTIWITEFNTHEGTRNTVFDKQSYYIQASIQKLKEQNIIEGFFIYELFDQPAFKIKLPHEASYGLLYKEGEKYIKKPAYLTYKQLIKQFNN